MQLNHYKGILEEAKIDHWRLYDPFDSPPSTEGLLNTFRISVLKEIHRMLEEGEWRPAKSYEKRDLYKCYVLNAFQVLAAACYQKTQKAYKARDKYWMLLQPFLHFFWPLPTAQQLWERHIRALTDLSSTKNNDYSSENIASGGILGVLVRICDKLARLNNGLVNNVALQVKDENLIETAKDLVNYSIYLIMLLEDTWWKTGGEAEWFIRWLKDNGAVSLRGMYQRGTGGIYLKQGGAILHSKDQS